MKFDSKKNGYVATLLASIALLFATTANAMTFNIDFDNDPNPGLSDPLVGAGMFSFSEDLDDGSYTLDSLTNVVFFAQFINGNTFTLSDTEDFLNEVLAVITTEGTSRVLRFAHINGNSGGTINGAFDFINQSGMNLSFAPSFEGSDFYGSGSDYFGNYSAVSAVPLPAAFWLLSSGFLLVFGIGRRS